MNPSVDGEVGTDLKTVKFRNASGKDGALLDLAVFFMQF
jgi:hypothetical protein